MVSYALVLKKSEGTSNAYVGSPVMSRCGENKRSIARLRIWLGSFLISILLIIKWAILVHYTVNLLTTTELIEARKEASYGRNMSPKRRCLPRPTQSHPR